MLRSMAINKVRVSDQIIDPVASLIWVRGGGQARTYGAGT